MNRFLASPQRGQFLLLTQRGCVGNSYGEYLKAPARRPAWLRVDRLLGEAGIPRDTAAGRRQFAWQMEERRGRENGEDWKPIRRGWCLGEETFGQELLAQMAGKMGEHHYGPERRESAIQKAERIVAAELGQMGWTQEDLERRAKADRWKVRVAARLRAETIMTLKWIAARLRMGSWKHLNGRLYDHRLQSRRKRKQCSNSRN